MEPENQAIVATSPSPDAASEVESLFSTVLYESSQQVQTGMEELLKMINDIDVHCAGIIEDMEKCKASALEKRKFIEEEKERFQNTAFAVLNLLNLGGDSRPGAA